MGNQSGRGLVDRYLSPSKCTCESGLEVLSRQRLQCCPWVSYCLTRSWTRDDGTSKEVVAPIKGGISPARPSGRVSKYPNAK